MFQLGQVLKGAASSYKISEKLYRTVWKAVNQQTEQTVVVKYDANHSHLKNEIDKLRRFQKRTRHIRPLIDEIGMSNEDNVPALVLKWLDDDILNTTKSRQLTRVELKRVSRGILEALKVIHEDGFIHTDVKPMNVLVNYSPSDGEITDIQLADLAAVTHEDSQDAIDGKVLMCLIYGDGFCIFSPDVSVDHEEYTGRILWRHNEFLGPFPLSYMEIAPDHILGFLACIIENTTEYKPFRNITKRELSDEDKAFLLKILKLDPRDRPTVKELLADEWFST
ncbi:hypothetical protein PRZ48_006920 [Zasmidium cellare]|uniref:Protein kinase domain-containing protein n=1 Tax=Zasmidium cellare TaxID=395010 RepID=A0ABR0EI01_ZASCE|nr:hypothetical protein PRZ48_006920 [Zasmidium cellare]